MNQSSATSPDSSPRSVADFEIIVIARLAVMRRRRPETIDPTRPFNELGIDSLDAVTLTGDLQEVVGHPIDPAELFDHPTPRAFAVFLADHCIASRSRHVQSD